MFLTSLKSNISSVYRAFHSPKLPKDSVYSLFPHCSSNPYRLFQNNFSSRFFSSQSKDEISKSQNPTKSSGLGKIFSLSQAAADLKKKHFIVIGDTGSGKSSFINVMTQKNDCKVSSQPQSVTQTCQWIETSLPKLGECLFIDTPGFGDTRPELNDRDILDIIMNEALDMHDKAELGFILCHSVRNTRSHAEIIFENFASTMGQDILKSTMVVLTSANLLQFDALSREIHQNFIKFLTEKFAMRRDLITEFDSVDPLANQRENVISTLTSLPAYDWKQIEFLKEENRVIFNQIQEQEKIEVEVMIPTPVQVEEPGYFTRYYEEMFLHEENKSNWVGWNYILLGIPYLITLEDVKTFTCRIPLSEGAYDFRVINAEATPVEGDFRDAVSEILEKPDRIELQSTLSFSFARHSHAKVKWKLMVEYEYAELRKKTIMIDKKEMKMVPRPDHEIWERVRAYQRTRFREKVRKLRLK